MVYSTRTIAIIASSAIAVVLMVIAVLASGPLPFGLQRVSAESTHDLLVAYAAKDTDADELPDWQEALYGTDPNNPHSVKPELLDGIAVAQGLVQPRFASATSTPVDLTDAPGVDTGPQTITDQFAREFFAQYLSQHEGQTPSPEELATFVEDGVSALSTSKARPDAYNIGQVRVAGTGPDALLAYAATAERVFLKHLDPDARDVTDYLSDGVHKNDSKALAKLAKIGATYSAISRDLIAMQVPKEVTTGHLALANAMARLGISTVELSTYGTDPLRTMLGVGEYSRADNELTAAYKSLYAVFSAQQVLIEKGTPGSHFYASLYYASQPITP